MSSAPEWMNWVGWRWISPIMAMAVGFFIGIDVQKTRERMKRYREDAAALMRRMKDGGP